MRIQLISRENGWGLSRDVSILRTILESFGHEVHFTDWKTPRKVARHFYGANIFLELLSPAFFGQARINYLIPNPEWFMTDWTKHLHGIDLVLAKTRDAERIFSTYRPTKYIGFTSEDRWADVPKRNAVLHLKGDSTAKGTYQVIEAAKLLPDIPFVFGEGDNDQIASLQRSCWIHCQPSTYEGFGHVLNEGRSCGAVMITTAAEPMTDIVHPEYGYGVPHCSEYKERLALHKSPCVDGLVEAIRHAWERTDKEGLGEIAREAFLKDREAFTKELNALFN